MADVVPSQAAEILQAGFPGAPAFALASRTAVALLARRQLAPEVLRENVLGDIPPGDVLEAMEVIAGVFLGMLSPDDRGARVLEALGLLTAEHRPEQRGDDLPGRL